MEGPKPGIEGRKQAPVSEAERSVSYLGVELPKAESAENAPKREQYADYINDAFSLELQKKIAVSLKQGDPLLIEGGTSIGKTTTIKKMAADLGWEVHYVNLTGATDVEDLMGRYVPNHNRVKVSDPEYVFTDGRITSGLRQEAGKRKIILLDEYNAAEPNVLIRLHEVLDALERNGEVVLAEDASEKIPVNKELTKVVGLMNPPGRGYLQRKPLDASQIRRWVYLKEASELPEESLDHSTRALFHLEKQTEEVEGSSFLYAAESALTPEQFKEIPGIETILEKYLEFHKGAKALLENRTIAKDQPQRFFFDDREEPKRVRDFIAAFYRGDLNATMQEALRYYYAGKLLEPTDKEALEELIRTVEYAAPTSSKRVGLEGKPAAEPAGAEAKVELSFEEAEKLFGKDFLGPAKVERVFGRKPEAVPAIQFPKAQLERAKELGQQLIFYTDTLPPISRGEKFAPLTLENLKKKFPKASDGAPTWYPQDWYTNEDFFKNQRPRTGWRLTSKEVIPGSFSKNYLEQTDVLIDHFSKQVFKGMKIPKEYENAISEFTRERPKISRMMDSDWRGASRALANLKITALARELPVEAMYRLILNDQADQEKPLAGSYTWTASRDSGGILVDVGGFDAGGVCVGRYGPGARYGHLGVSFSRS